MGSAVDSHRIRLVMARHREELLADLQANFQSKLIKAFTLESSIDAVIAVIELIDGTSIELPRYWDVDGLVDRFSDCL
jgi:hypothetical protein